MTPALHEMQATRDEVKRRAEDDFLNLYLEHGGYRRWNSLRCLFHADETPSARIFRARFHCFGCGISLDVFEFIQRIRGEDFKGALAFLAARYSVPLKQRTITADEISAYARQRAAAEKAAAELDARKQRMLAALRERRDLYFRAYHRCRRFITAYSFDHPAAAFIADACESYEGRYQDLDHHIERVNHASTDEIRRFFGPPAEVSA